LSRHYDDRPAAIHGVLGGVDLPARPSRDSRRKTADLGRSFTVACRDMLAVSQLGLERMTNRQLGQLFIGVIHADEPTPNRHQIAAAIHRPRPGCPQELVAVGRSALYCRVAGEPRP